MWIRCKTLKTVYVLRHHRLTCDGQWQFLSALPLEVYNFKHSDKRKLSTIKPNQFIIIPVVFHMQLSLYLRITIYTKRTKIYLMKKNYFTLLFVVLIGIALNAQTSGELTVSATTSSTGGNFAPRNVVAIWIEDEAGNFIKTLLAYAQERKTHLNTWQATTTEAGSPYNVVDAITGATRTSHATRNCSWDGTDIDGNLVDDGNYKVWMELTDKNSTGNFSSFSFTKGTEPESLTPSDVPSFATITINWMPLANDIADNSIQESFTIFPNPTSGKFEISGEAIKEIEIRSIFGDLISKGSSSQINISYQPNGIYLILITTNKGMAIEKIVKQ